MPEEAAATTTTVLMVVGAGRGPLVAASLRAAARAQRLLKVFAVEKNPNAVVTLQHRVVAEGWQVRGGARLGREAVLRVCTGCCAHPGGGGWWLAG